MIELNQIAKLCSIAILIFRSDACPNDLRTQISCVRSLEEWATGAYFTNLRTPYTSYSTHYHTMTHFDAPGKQAF